jgi:hypothetical protein
MRLSQKTFHGMCSYGTSQSYAQRDDHCLFCQIQEVAILYSDSSNKDVHECVLDSTDNTDGSIYQIDLPQEFITAHQEQIDIGVMVCVVDGVVDTSSNQIINSGTISVARDQTQKRSLASTSGESFALAVRVKSSNTNEEPLPDLLDLQGRIFGKGEKRESTNIASQYELCSKGKFRIRPATTGEVRKTYCSMVP